MPFGVTTPETPIGVPEGQLDIIHVDDRVVPCDGGDEGGGHPRVWLRIVHDRTFCPYCSRVFVLNPNAGEDGH